MSRPDITTEFKRIADTDFPKPWPEELEFSSPARGTQNIVHTGMLIPESHQIFVCAKGCLRGVVLTAAEMGEMGRYSALEIREENVLNGDMEQMMIEGVTDIIRKLPRRPRVIELFISCQHFFLAYDQKHVFQELRSRFTDIDFIDCYMIPTLRKSGITPDQKMRIQMYGLLRRKPVNPGRINHIGSNHQIRKYSELYEIAAFNDYELKSIHDARTYDEYLDMASACMNIFTEPLARMAAEEMESKLYIPYTYMPNCFRLEDIDRVYRSVMLHLPDLSEHIKNTRIEIDRAKSLIGNRPIVIDYTLTFRTLNLTRFLLEEGFKVTDIYIDTFLPEERADYEWIREKHPDLLVHPTNRPSMRFEDSRRPEALALGQKAAAFAGTDCFVNLAEGGGLFGYAGVCELMELMQEAVRRPKDRRTVIQKKGCNVHSMLDDASKGCSIQPEKAVGSTGNGYSASLIPTYSSDEFGACQALYELGGMVVMHDASGCNSTYTTHDEPRWYDHPSMIYISAISELEAIMGDDEKLIRDIEKAAEVLKPRFVAIIGAPIPYMTGTDFDAISRVLENRLGIPVFPIKANGMNGYGRGIELALTELIRVFSKNKTADTGRRVNLLGYTPLDYGVNGALEAIKDWLAENGLECGCTFTVSSSLEDIAEAAAAEVNLVLSYGGLKAAELMKKQYGIPYVVGAPIGLSYAGQLADRLADPAADEEYQAVAEDVQIAIIGEAVTSVSLAKALKADYGIDAVVIAACETAPELLRPQDIAAPSEDAVISAVSELAPAAVIADPFYRAIVNKSIRFIELPHEALSGRIYDAAGPCLINRDLMDILPIGDINA